MSLVLESPITVLGPGLDEARVRELVHDRSINSRLRRMAGRSEVLEVDHELYWPVGLVHATARSAGRRRWVERVQGAVDLITGRVGLVDLDVPDTRELHVDERDCIPSRVPRHVAELRWHEFFRDHVDRKHKPMRPPALTIDRIERVWLPNHVVSVGSRRYLVDGMTARVDELSNFPSVEHLVSSRTDTPTQGDLT